MGDVWIHWSVDGIRARLETCRHQREPITQSREHVTCERCLEQLFRVPRRKKGRRGALTREQVQAALMLAKGPKRKALIACIYAYGLRASEPGLIRMTDLDLKQQTITVQRMKGSETRTYSLAGVQPHLGAWLLERKRRRIESAWLFPSAVKGRDSGISRWVPFRLWHRLAHELGLPPEFQFVHRLKSAIATHMVEDGLELAQVQAYLGHTSIRNTERYAKPTDRMVQTIGARFFADQRTTAQVRGSSGAAQRDRLQAWEVD